MVGICPERALAFSFWPLYSRGISQPEIRNHHSVRLTNLAERLFSFRKCKTNSKVGYCRSWKSVSQHLTNLIATRKTPDTPIRLPALSLFPSGITGISQQQPVGVLPALKKCAASQFAADFIHPPACDGVFMIPNCIGVRPSAGASMRTTGPLRASSGKPLFFSLQPQIWIKSFDATSGEFLLLRWKTLFRFFKTGLLSVNLQGTLSYDFILKKCLRKLKANSK